MRTTVLACFFLIIFCNVFCQQADSLLNIISRGNRDVEEAKAYNALANIYMRTDLDKARAYQMTGIALSKSIGSEVYLSSGYIQLVSILHNMGKTDSAAIYLSYLKNLALRPGVDIRVKGNFYASAGLFYKKTGELKKAIPMFKQAIATSILVKNNTNTAGQYINLGNTYNLLGEYKNALINHLKALKIFEEEDNKKGQSFCYQNISNSFIELKRYQEALEYAGKSIVIKNELNDARGIVTAEIGLGQIYLGLKKHTTALEHFNTAAEMAKNLKLVSELAKINFNTAKVYLEKKDTSTAVNYFKESKAMALKVGDSATATTVEVELLALQNKKIISVTEENTMINSIGKLQESGQLPKEISGYQNIAEFYASSGQFEKALEYTKKYYQYSDSLKNNELQTQIKKIVEQFNLDKKEKEIAILKKDQQLKKVEIEKQKVFQTAAMILLAMVVVIGLLIINRYKTVNKSKRLLEMEKMRNGIARDLHDDIGSTLTSINILSKVLLQQTMQDDSTRSTLQKIKDHSSNIMESMSDIVWAINPHNDTVEKVIYKMKEFASEVLEPLNIKFTFLEQGGFSNVKLTLNKRKDLYLIFKEAVNNAAKYSNCKNIRIVLNHDGEQILLQVKDDGHGFDQNLVKKGNGVRNIYERAKNMVATLQFDSSAETGTDILLTVPVT
ncbi:MAG TPA: tetratricopeptide repeat protein [Ferruginibacter sp.]|nr:tetratricopeptide repeat protein [Ferruginibacter sp.]